MVTTDRPRHCPCVATDPGLGARRRRRHMTYSLVLVLVLVLILIIPLILPFILTRSPHSSSFDHHPDPRKPSPSSILQPTHPLNFIHSIDRRRQFLGLPSDPVTNGQWPVGVGVGVVVGVVRFP
jgi:hypothetical protein